MKLSFQRIWSISALGKSLKVIKSKDNLVTPIYKFHCSIPSNMIYHFPLPHSEITYLSNRNPNKAINKAMLNSIIAGFDLKPTNNLSFEKKQ